MILRLSAWGARYFVVMTIEEAAEVLGISSGTAKRHWAYARAWLAQEIKSIPKM